MRDKIVFISILSLLIISGFTSSVYALEPDRTATTVDIQENTDAVLEFRLTYVLESDTDEQAFQEYQNQINNGGGDISSDFRDAIEILVSRAGNGTAREMRVNDFTVEARVVEVPVKRGVVEYRFTWTNFAETSDGDIIVDDVLNGYVLGDGDTLTVNYPDGYKQESISPSPDETQSSSFVWRGPTSFSTDQPRITLTQQESGTPLWPVIIAVILLLLGAGIAYYRYSGFDSPSTDSNLDLSDEEKVMNILSESGGKIKQKDIVDETGWSAAKVSQVTSKLNDKGEIEKQKMGRENIISLSE